MVYFIFSQIKLIYLMYAGKRGKVLFNVGCT